MKPPPRTVLIIATVTEGILLALMAISFAFLLPRVIAQQDAITCDGDQVTNLASVLAMRDSLGDQSRQAQITWSAAQATDAADSPVLRTAGLAYVVTMSKINAELGDHPVPVLRHC